MGRINLNNAGPDLGELRRIGGEAYDALKSVRGVVDLQTEPLFLIPQLKIAIDRESSAGYGLRSGSNRKRKPDFAA